MRFFRKSGNFSKKDYQYLRSVYLAVCEIDSDYGEHKKPPAFIKTVSTYAGMYRETVAVYLRALQKLGVIDYWQVQNPNGKFSRTKLWMPVWQLPTSEQIRKANRVIHRKRLGPLAVRPLAAGTASGPDRLFKNNPKGLSLFQNSSKEEIKILPQNKSADTTHKNDYKTDVVVRELTKIFHTQYLKPQYSMDHIDGRRYWADLRTMGRMTHEISAVKIKKILKWYIANHTKAEYFPPTITCMADFAKKFPKIMEAMNRANSATNSPATTSHLSPAELMDKHFGSPNQWTRYVLEPALELTNGSDPTTVAAGICRMADWIKANQKRPSSDADLSDQRWDLIPTQFGIMEGYVKWLPNSWVQKDVNERCFQPESGVFKNYLTHAQTDVGFNFMNGEII
jgi:hypothetical protein